MTTATDEIGLPVYGLFSIAVMLVLASFLVMGILHFVAGVGGTHLCLIGFFSSQSFSI